MISSEIAAYIGAAAWLYPLGLLIYNVFVMPKVSFFPDQYASIGFTSLGPVFNLRLNIYTTQKTAVINNLTVEIRHEKGNTEFFECTGIDELYNEITGQDGQKQSVGKSGSPIVIMLRKDWVNDAFFKFWQRGFRDEKAPYHSGLLKADLRLKKTQNPYDFNSFFDAQEMNDYMKFMRSKFFWLPGKYSIEFKVQSNSKISLKNQKHAFSLSQDDIDILRANYEKIKEELSWAWHKDNFSGENKPRYPMWNWPNVRITKN